VLNILLNFLHIIGSFPFILLLELYDKGGIDSDRLYEFLEKYITKKYKNKLIILDNASSNRNAKIKELVNKHNTFDFFCCSYSCSCYCHNTGHYT